MQQINELFYMCMAGGASAALFGLLVMAFTSTSNKKAATIINIGLTTLVAAGLAHLIFNM